MNPESKDKIWWGKVNKATTNTKTTQNAQKTHMKRLGNTQKLHRKHEEIS